MSERALMFRPKYRGTLIPTFEEHCYERYKKCAFCDNPITQSGPVCNHVAVAKPPVLGYEIRWVRVFPFVYRAEKRYKLLFTLGTAYPDYWLLGDLPADDAESQNPPAATWIDFCLFAPETAVVWSEEERAP